MENIGIELPPEPLPVVIFDEFKAGNLNLGFLILEKTNYPDLKEPETNNTLLHLAILENKLVDIILIVKRYEDYLDLRNKSG
jgi:hypothetical protein